MMELCTQCSPSLDGCGKEAHGSARHTTGDQRASTSSYLMSRLASPSTALLSLSLSGRVAALLPAGAKQKQQQRARSPPTYGECAVVVELACLRTDGPTTASLLSVGHGHGRVWSVGRGSRVE